MRRVTVRAFARHPDWFARMLALHIEQRTWKAEALDQERQTPVLSAEEMRTQLRSIHAGTLIDLRDRALIGLLGTVGIVNIELNENIELARPS